LITSALGLMVALACNTAIRSLFTETFGEAGVKLGGQLFCTILIMLVVIFAAISIGRAAERAKKVGKERKKVPLRTLQ
jgi:uncharacterized membrane protein